MKEQQSLVSVIIGCYNVASYLKKELACIRNQSYSNLEILLIDDGSTDETSHLCDQLATLDTRIQVIHKENGGLGSARNAGLDAANGEFIWFYDVDDEASIDLIEKNVRWMQQHNVDLTVFGFYVIDEKTGDREKIEIPEHLVTSNEELKTVYTDVLLQIKHGNGFNWNKFYRKSFIDRYDFRFDNLRIQQDEIFNIKLYPHLQRVYISSECLYDYLMVITGNTRSRYLKDRFEIVSIVHDRLLSFAKSWGVDSPAYIEKIELRYLAGINSEIRFNLFHPDAKFLLFQKRVRIHSVLQYQEVQKTISFLLKSTKVSKEDRLFLFLYKNNLCYSVIFMNIFIRKLRFGFRFVFNKQ